MTEKRSRGRPAQNILRITLNLNADDIATKRLIKEAKARGVTIQDHIRDLLAIRYLAGVNPPLLYTPPTDDTLNDE